MNARVAIAVLAFGAALVTPVLASDVAYIYGRVETTRGDVFEGQIRWGTEESFWDDIFNSTKVENENLDYVNRRALRRIRSHHWDGWNFFGNNDRDLTHVFAIRFGDLKRIEVEGGDDVIAVFRNGEELRLEGGSNDVGAPITVVDPDLGRHELQWNRIRSVQFMDTPSKLEDKLGEPIYGTVSSGRYDFTGRIQWDNDECLTSDKLDGQTLDGKVSVAFRDVAAIRKHRSGALVTLNSGTELYVSGTNDVNHSNRGVVVVVPRLGSVKIGWEDFDEVTFSPAPHSGRGYSDYGRGRDLMGTVVTRDGRYEGRLVFDLDESWDFEMLHGTNQHTEYLIPFRDIARIRPEGERSDVELRMGLTIELKGSHDVTRRNDGLLVFEGDRKPRYVDWSEVDEVVFH